MSNITTQFLDKENKFAIGKNIKTNDYILSIPVANQLTDYLEYYRLTLEQYNEFLDQPVKALPFVDKCRNRELDELFILKPGKDRGVPI